MVMDISEPRDYEIRALCLVCRQARSKQVSIKPENQDAEEMAFLLQLTSSHEHKEFEQWTVDWEEVS